MEGFIRRMLGGVVVVSLREVVVHGLACEGEQTQCERADAALILLWVI